MRAPRLATLSVALLPLAILATCTDIGAPTRPGGQVSAPLRRDVVPGGDPIVLAVGDAVCGTGTSASSPCKDAEVAATISALNPSAVLLLGDLQYENGTLADFNAFYNASYGAFKSISRPAAGNHEYNTVNASGYYDYFNGVGVQSGLAGDRSKGYYSFNLGSWHLIALNSNCSAIGGCGAGSAQEQWLRADLAASTASCTLAYWHHPLFSSGAHGNNTTVKPLYQALYDYGADLVLSGHDHTYERFAPQTANGILDQTRGVREFVVGTGGKEQTAFSTIRANSEVRSNTAFGVLQLTLRATGYDWQFVPIPGNALSDAGAAACSAPVTPPPPQTTLTIAASADAYTLKNSPKSNYGSRSSMLVDGSPVARSYFKFSVTGIGARTVATAKLQLFAVDPSDTGGRLHRVSSTSWSESTIRWSNQPTYDAAVIGTIGSVVSGLWYEVDVTDNVSVDGSLSFALESTSTNGADYRTREGGSSTSPRLVVVLK